MDFESKIISREISQLLWEQEKTVGTAESCTGGRIAEAIIAVPGSSKYYKGGVVSYTDGERSSEDAKLRLCHRCHRICWSYSRS